VSLNERPRIVVTVADPARHADPAFSARRNALYADGVERHGGSPLLLDGSSSETARTAAFATMDGLLMSGGADIDPTRYGAKNMGSVDIETERDGLEAAAWAAAEEREVPVFGICRGFQAINVFSGGTLLQDVGGHAGPGWGTGPARTHPLRLAESAGLTTLVAPDGERDLEVNTYHHQGVRAGDLAPGLIATAWAESEVGELIEAFERPGPRFVVGVQCHPERSESTPAGFESLWRAFIEACRQSAAAAV
jgi:putative glutamine amidotransferase